MIIKASYSIITRRNNLVVIEDVGTKMGRTTVTNDAEAVVAELTEK